MIDAQLQSAVCIIASCLSWHLWINLSGCLSCMNRAVDLFQFWIPYWEPESWLQISWEIRQTDRHGCQNSQATWLVFSHIHTDTHTTFQLLTCARVSWFIDISGILPVSHQLSIFSKNKHCPWKANYVAWKNDPKRAQTALRVWARDQLNPQRWGIPEFPHTAGEISDMFGADRAERHQAWTCWPKKALIASLFSLACPFMMYCIIFKNWHFCMFFFSVTAKMGFNFNISFLFFDK